MDKTLLQDYQSEISRHLTQELLPFWIERMVDRTHGGYLTHFDQYGTDSGTDEKSLISQTRSIYTLASAHRAGYGGGTFADLARHGVDFLLRHMWDEKYGGFYWMCDRSGKVIQDQKIVYGLSFAIYSLSEYTLATEDPKGLEYASRTFDLLQKYAVDTHYGGYFEMFDREWNLSGPGSKGGDRKTLDAHMHLMEAFTTLYEASQTSVHRRKLMEIIEILKNRMMHSEYGTGIPQFFANWEVAPQIKFEVVWGWDRFEESGKKAQASDNTSYGHNVEFAWLLSHALDILNVERKPYEPLMSKAIDHALDNGIDWEYGGVYVEGPHKGGVYDREKEFWQQAEVMVGMLEACLRWGPEKYEKAYDKVHRFVFDYMVHDRVGEWWPLLTRKGEPVWTHMSHSWKVNYHTVRAMLECWKRLDLLKKKREE